MDVSRSVSRRIICDLIGLDKDPIDGIHLRINENNILDIECLIVGPVDTPYEGGFYMFKIQMPTTYPDKPPKVTFVTTDGRIRFHPNLYACGKVCLSILGTWDGPSWSPVMSLRSVVLSLQSLLGYKNPLICEPGFENENVLSERNKTYNMMLTFQNIRYAIAEMIRSPTLLRFKDIIGTIYSKNETTYRELLTKRHVEYCETHTNGETVQSIYGMNLPIDYRQIRLPTMNLATDAAKSEATKNDIVVTKNDIVATNTDSVAESLDKMDIS